MRFSRFVLSILLVCAAQTADATVNHGDFLGTSVDFLQVSETTTTAGDPEPVWNAPSLGGAGDQLVFFPSGFISSCSAGGSDTTASTLTTTITAQPGGNIDTIMLTESGDTTLTAFPPFGTPDTNSSAALTGTATITETTSGPIAPIVVPFSGTFVPSDTFSLPGNFGTSNWSGSISIDIESVEPLATVVELSLENTLDTNCAAGATSAVIEKKTVSGPAVAIAVNPLECALELDKTCCVTQPALPDLGTCEGDLTRVVFEYTGDKCRRSNNDQGRAFRCYGRRSLGDSADITFLRNASTLNAVPMTDVDRGELVEITSTTGTLPNKLKMKVKDDWWRRQIVKIDTSCERAFECGDKFGAFTVTEFESTTGGLVDCNAPPGPPVCAVSGDPVGTACTDRLVDIVFEYNGQACQDPLGNPQGGFASCEGDATGSSNVGVVYAGPYGWRHQVSPASNINDGDRVRVTATGWGGLYGLQNYLITDDSGVLQELDIKTNCYEPIALGDEFGSFKVVEFTQKNGTRVALGSGDDGPFDACEVPLSPPGPHCTSDLEALTLVYIGDFLGEGCTVSNSQSGFAHCSGVDDPGDPVSVVETNGHDIDPIDSIEFGDLVTVTDPSGGDLGNFVNIDVTGAGGTQWLQIKTSCHKPLSLGDRFGSFVVFGMVREDEGPVSLGGNVQYQYKVTNPGTSTVDNVSIDDDQLGNVVSGLSLTPGEMQEFVLPATLLGTTTNVATATGDVAGAICDPGTDSVTVTVTAPPQGSFRCACWQSLTEVTLIWDGTQAVDIVAYDGAVGGTVLASVDGVMPGDAVSVGGFSQDESVWEIFEAGTTNKLGESKFELTCRDRSMNGVEDCGKRVGDGKYNDPGFLNDWLVEGLVDDDETLECSPEVVGPPPACGFGPELLLLLPPLLWAHRRGLREEDEATE